MVRYAHDISDFRPPTEEEIEEDLRAIEMVHRHAQERFAANGYKPYSVSLLELLEESRREADERLL